MRTDWQAMPHELSRQRPISCSTLSTVVSEVRALPAEGRPVTRSENSPLAPRASISCVLPDAPGSATSLTSVRSNPRPCSASVAATLAFFGKSRAAPRASPSKNVAGESTASRSSRSSAGEPRQAAGGFTLR